MSKSVKPPAKGVKTMLDAALDYGRARLKIFPILEMTKDQPLIKQWGVRASSDAKQIKEWWTRWPQANIGLACMPSGIAVIDSDAPNGENTLRDLETFDAKLLSPTRMAKTPRGGIHRFYRGRVATTVGRIGPNVDTRGQGSGNGGYVLLAPSRTPQGSYAWLPGTSPLADVDEWVVEACGSSVDNGPASQVPLVEWDLPANVERAREYLKTDAPVSKQGAGGDETLVKKVAPTLKDFGISEELAGELMAELWNDRCEPPWQLGDCADADNLFVKIHNGYIYCRDNAPGSATAQADFADGSTPEELEDAAIIAEAEASRTEAKQPKKRWEKECAVIVTPPMFIDLTKRALLSDKSFAKKYGHYFGTRKQPAAEANRSKNILRYDRAGYRPASPGNAVEQFEKDGESHFNLYRAPAITPLRDRKPEIFLAHLRYLIPDQKSRREFADWLAWLAQRPDRKTMFAALMIGPPGTGKSWVAELVKIIMGEHNVSTPRNKTITRDFNGWMAEKTLAIIHELKGKVETVEILKDLITQKTVEINRKGIEAFEIENFINFLTISNHDDAVPLDDDDRRYLVLQCAGIPFGAKPEPSGGKPYTRTPAMDDYYARLFASQPPNSPPTDETRRVLAWLLDRKITLDCEAMAPGTRAHVELVKATRTSLQTMIGERYRAKEAPFHSRVFALVDVGAFIDLSQVDPKDRTIQAVTKACRDLGCRPILDEQDPPETVIAPTEKGRKRVWARTGADAALLGTLTRRKLARMYDEGRKASDAETDQEAAADAADDFAPA